MSDCTDTNKQPTRSGERKSRAANANATKKGSGQHQDLSTNLPDVEGIASGERRRVVRIQVRLADRNAR